MKSKKEYLKNWVVLTPWETKDKLVDQIENELTEQEILLAYNLLQEANLNSLSHRISGFSWNKEDFSVKLETGVSYSSGR